MSNERDPRSNILSPCRWCTRARDCCSDVSLVTTSPNQKDEWLRAADESGLSCEVVEIQGGVGWIVRFTGQCPGFDRETEMCGWWNTELLPPDCGPGGYPLNADGMVEEGTESECPDRSQFVPQPKNGFFPVMGQVEDDEGIVWADGPPSGGGWD